MNDHWYLKGELSVYNEDSDDDNQFIHLSNTARIQYGASNYHRYEMLSLGVDRDVIGSWLTIGANLLLGKNRNHTVKLEAEQHLDSQYNLWTVYDPDQLKREERTSYYVNTGASINANINLNLAKRWGFILSYEAALIQHFKTSETINSFHDNAPYFTTPAEETYTQYRGNIQTMLRFRF